MIRLLFENDDILAVDKREGLASIPEGREAKECMLSLLSSAFPGKLYVVHRLDREVSGVMLFAKNAAGHRYLNEQFSSGKVRKSYLALTYGVIKETGGTIDKAIREFG